MSWRDALPGDWIQTGAAVVVTKVEGPVEPSGEEPRSDAHWDAVDDPPPMAPTFRGSPGDDVTRTGAGSCRASWELGATIPSALEARISAMWRATWTRHLPQPAAWDRRGAPSARYWRGGWRARTG